jgi:hypothetical protein
MNSDGHHQISLRDARLRAQANNIGRRSTEWQQRRCSSAVDTSGTTGICPQHETNVLFERHRPKFRWRLLVICVNLALRKTPDGIA